MMLASDLRPGMSFVSSGGSLSELIVAVMPSESQERRGSHLRVMILMIYNDEESRFELDTYTYGHDDDLYDSWFKVT